MTEFEVLKMTESKFQILRTLADAPTDRATLIKNIAEQTGSKLRMVGRQIRPALENLGSKHLVKREVMEDDSVIFAITEAGLQSLERQRRIRENL